MEHEVCSADVDAIIARHGVEARAAIPILQEIQQRYAYLPEQALERVCERTEITPATITSIATFYSQFRLRPAGRHTIKVCVGTACHVMGAESIFDAFCDHLGIGDGDDTDARREFTVEKVACLGCCMLAPAVQIDGMTFGFLTPDRVPRVIDQVRSARIPLRSDQPFTANGQPARGEVRTCLCSSCVAAGSDRVRAELAAEIERLRLPVILKDVGCTGMAYQTPLVEVVTSGNGGGDRYGRVRPEHARSILLTHFKPGSVGRRIRAAAESALERLLTDDRWAPPTSLIAIQGPDRSFVAAQRAIVTEHGGRLTPLDLDEYLSHGGFATARRCLLNSNPDEICSELEASGLRGRGGAGFPTARKWRTVLRARGDEKHIICNGDEGDPGAFMDRLILESFPFKVIEGMVIASRAVGARRGFLYIRAEYPVAVARIRQALELCRQAGWLGEAIQGSSHSLELEVVCGAGAFVCGEETALIAAIEGRRGTPRLRPPYPAEEGLWGRPTLVNNVETFALVPSILGGKSHDFAELGSPSSRGTKTFALAGKVARSGLIEVPMGMTLRQIVEEIGGGVANGRALKAIQVGGPSGGCVPAWLADTPVDYEALSSPGAMMGSGGMVVLDQGDCMVDIARYFMAFTQAESCGTCTFCRVGTKRMLEILEALCRGQATAKDLERLEELAHLVIRGSLCGLGRTAPNPVLSTLVHFRDEYEAHVKGFCPAGVCRDLVQYRVGERCVGCTRCAQRCPTGAISFTPYERHSIDPERCVRCGACRRACPEDAVEVVARGSEQKAQGPGLRAQGSEPEIGAQR